jgi:uncharacterized protein YcbK (DUF882 family)
MGEPEATPAPELLRLRKELARKRREPIRIIIATDSRRPVRTLTIPRSLPLALLVGATILILTAIGLSFDTWSMRSRVAGLKKRVIAMVQVADNLALYPQSGQGVVLQGMASLHLQKPSGEQGHFAIAAANAAEEVEVNINLASGELDEASNRAIRRLMRCRRTGAEVPIDPRLIELLWNLSQRTGQKIIVISGYRAPAFAAAGSYHPRGMAADIRIPGLTALMIRDLAKSLGARGIGYYPRSQFVHVDVRDEPYFWTDLGAGEGAPDPEVEGDDEPAGKSQRAPSP